MSNVRRSLADKLDYLHQASRTLLESEARFIRYHKLRTGLTFKQIRVRLSVQQREARRSGKYMFVTRHTVLGRLHEIKREQFELEGDVESVMTRDELIKYIITKGNNKCYM